MNKNVSLAIKKAVSNLNRIEESNLKELNNKRPDLFSLNDQTELFQNDKGITIKIDRSRDKNLTDFGRATLSDRYLGQDESYQDLFARVASTYADNNLHAQRLYNYISNLWFMPATPVLSNGGTERGLPISCFLNEAGDSLESQPEQCMHVGKEVAKRANSFGMQIYYNNRNKLSKNIEKKYNISYLNFDELISECKFIVLLLPLTKASTHLFTKKVFKKMRKDSYLVNVARGKIIKETDLIDAISKKEIAGAALDVFENEPKVEKKLLSFKNVVLMPHAGSATREARLEMMKLACNNLENYLLKGKVNNLVNKDLR